MLQMTAKLKAKLTALKHSVHSKGRAPWEDADAFEANRRKWREYLRPFDPLLEEACEELAMLDWQRRRNRKSLLLYALCEPFGQIIAQHPDQEWTDVATNLLKKRDEDFSRIIDALKHLQEWAKQINDPKLEKRILNQLADIQSVLRRIASLQEITLEYFMGLGEENRKQAERAIEFNASLHKLFTHYMQLEEYVAARNKLRPACIEHSRDEPTTPRPNHSDDDDHGAGG
jgi:hypothetical protein